jgi:methionine synthase II (cobalamin-independent)
VDVDKPSIRLTISNTLSIPIYIIGLEDSGVSRSVSARGTSTYTCYGKYSTVFDRMLKIANQTSYDFSNVNVRKSGASSAYKKYTNSTSPGVIIIDIHESPAQDFTIVVSESTES